MTIALWVCLLTGAARSDGPSSAVDAPGQKLGYAIGHQVGGDFRRDSTPLDADAVVLGIRDALEESTPRWTATEMRNALRRLEQSRRSRSKPAP
jgi:FKBP-type peptidyl-prolyl cis-trans isomerase FklB